MLVVRHARTPSSVPQITALVLLITVFAGWESSVDAQYPIIEEDDGDFDQSSIDGLPSEYSPRITSRKWWGEEEDGGGGGRDLEDDLYSPEMVAERQQDLTPSYRPSSSDKLDQIVREIKRLRSQSSNFDKRAISVKRRGMTTNSEVHLPTWIPILLIGSIGSILVVTMIVGTTFYYTRAKKRRGELAKDMLPSMMAEDAVSQRGSLLGGSDADRKLAHSAQMFHYQHQKQQMIAMDKSGDQATSSRQSNSSGVDDDRDDEDDEEEGDFTVYECPAGLASTGQLEVENPVFDHSLVEQARSDSPPSTKSSTAVESMASTSSATSPSDQKH